MGGSAPIDWDVCERCAEEGGIGVRLPTGGKCWAHANDKDLDAALKRLGRHGHVDARGVLITQELLGRLLAAAPRYAGGAALTGVRFDRATFQGDAGFDRATFYGDAGFAGATFQGDVGFAGVTFEGRARFDGAIFKQARRLGPVLGRAHVSFDDAVFDQRIRIEVSSPLLSCRSARFSSGVQFGLRWAAVVLDDADLGDGSILAGVPPFLQIEPVFEELRENRVRAAAKRLEPPRRHPAQPWVTSLRRANVGGLTIANVDLRWCLFTGAHNLDRLRLESANRFAATPGCQVGWGWPPVWRWTRRDTLAEEQFWRAPHEHGIRRKRWYDENSPVTNALLKPDDPEDAEVAEVIEGWTLRRSREWAREIAGLYRALRKGREENKDEPGAADFYYGEMEMRRKAASGSNVERVTVRPEMNRKDSPKSIAEQAVLTLYWLVSGYALRTWRALAALALVILVAAAIFATIGFKPPQSPRFVPIGVSSTGTLVYKKESVQRPSSRGQFLGALGYSAEVATSLLRAPDLPLYAVGAWTQAILRWLGPLLFGLAILSLRGRVKR